MALNIAKAVAEVTLAELTVSGGPWQLKGGAAVRVISTPDRQPAIGVAVNVYVLGEDDIRERGGPWILTLNKPYNMRLMAEGWDRDLGTVLPVYPVDENGNWDPDAFGSCILIDGGELIRVNAGGDLLAWKSNG